MNKFLELIALIVFVASVAAAYTVGHISFVCIAIVAFIVSVNAHDRAERNRLKRFGV